MKKVLFELILILGLSLTGLTAAAQKTLYVGGSFGLSASDSHYSRSGSLQSLFNLSVAPDFGWRFKENLSAGFRPTFGFLRMTTGDQEIRSTSVGINPYVRYRVVGFHRFGLWAEADANMDFKQEWNLNDGMTISKTRTYSQGIQALPVLTWQLNKHISLETRLNIFSFGLTNSHAEYNDNAELNSVSFGLNATSKDIFGDLGDITVGFLYSF